MTAPWLHRWRTVGGRHAGPTLLDLTRTLSVTYCVRIEHRSLTHEDLMPTTPIPTSTPASAVTTSTQPYRLRWVVAAVVLVANVMDLLDGTIVNVAAPSIHRELGGGASTIQWLSAGYTLAFAVLLIAGARLGDILGRRRMFLVGSAGFTLT